MEDRLYKQEEYRECTIKVLYDYDPQSPREWGSLGTIYSNSRNYDPDRHSIEEIIDSDTGKLDKEFVKSHIMLHVYAYEHSGITISTSRGGQFSDPWDSGLFGIIAMSKEDAIKNWGKKICTKEVREKALKHLEAEVETLDQYYTGDVYGYVIEDENGDEIDSCWGYFGHEWIDKCMIPECKSIIDNDIRKREEKHCERIEKVKSNILLLIGCTFIDRSDMYRVKNTPLFSMPMIEKATQVKGMIRDDFYSEIKLSDVPEDVLENMVSVIK